MQQRILGIGYSVYAGDDTTLRQLGAALDEADRLKPDFIELPLYQLDVIARGRVMPEKLKALKALTAGRSYGYTVHGPLSINLMDEPSRLERHKDVLKASLEISAALGAVHFILHGGTAESEQAAQLESLYQQQREALLSFGELAQSLGLIITVENLFGFLKSRFVPLPSRLAEEISAVNHSHIKACLDFSHGFLNATQNGADFGAEMRALAPLAKHLHIHDSFGLTQDITTYWRSERLAYGLGDLHLPLGWGTIPWEEMMTELAFPPGLVLNLELPPQYWTELEPCLERLRALARLAEDAAQSRSAVG